MVGLIVISILAIPGYYICKVLTETLLRVNSCTKRGILWIGIGQGFLFFPMVHLRPLGWILQGWREAGWLPHATAGQSVGTQLATASAALLVCWLLAILATTLLVVCVVRILRLVWPKQSLGTDS